MGEDTADERTDGEEFAVKPVLITELAGIAEIEDEWRALAELRSNGFVTPEWLWSWWAHQGSSSGSSLLVVAVRRDDGTLAGVMPLALDASRRPRAIRFAGARLGDRFHPAASEEDEDAVAAAAMECLEAHGVGRHIVLLEHTDPGRSWWRQMQAAGSRRRSATEQQLTELPYVPLTGLDWESYVSQRSSKFRAQIRRRERVLLRDHQMQLRSATPQSLEADLGELFRLHSLRWQRGSSSLDAPGAQDVLRAFATAAQRRGWLRLRILEAEGAAVAAFFGWRLGGSYVSYQGGFDPAWSNKSVGTVLTASTIRDAIEEGADEFDFLLGTEGYKRSFTATARPAETVVLVGATSPARALVAGEAGARRLGRGLAKRPGLGRVARSLARARRRS